MGGAYPSRMKQDEILSCNAQNSARLLVYGSLTLQTWHKYEVFVCYSLHQSLVMGRFGLQIIYLSINYQ